MNFTKGEIIAINKPLGMTSFCALAYVRKRISVRLGVKRIKIGHAGTLDPLATGVLVLCTGKFTKRIEEFQLHGKEYTATLQLGATTPSYDMEHPVSETFPTDGITRERIEEVLRQFEGDIEQVPPTFSACKIGGQRAYDLRRKGEDVKLKAKQIHIDEIELIGFDPEKMQMSIRVVCGKGTYIRALARDIGRALNSGAYLTELCRTRSGEYRVENCIELKQFDEWLAQQTIETNEDDEAHNAPELSKNIKEKGL